MICTFVSSAAWDWVIADRYTELLYMQYEKLYAELGMMPVSAVFWFADVAINYTWNLHDARFAQQT